MIKTKFAFNTGKRTFLPVTEGKKSSEVTREELLAMTTELTEEEKDGYFSKYFEVPMPAVQKDHFLAMQNGPLPTGLTRFPWELGKALNKIGYDECENGYGLLPNGFGYVACKIDLVGHTDERLDYFYDTFNCKDTASYKLWFPGAHLYHFTDGCVEDFGFGMQNLEWNFVNCDLSKLGFDMDRIQENDPACFRVALSASKCSYLYEPDAEDDWMCMLSYYRETPYGQEARIRFYVGMYIDENGECIFKEGNTSKYSVLDKARIVYEHCATEYCRAVQLVNMHCDHPIRK